MTMQQCYKLKVIRNTSPNKKDSKNIENPCVKNKDFFLFKKVVILNNQKGLK